MLFVNGLVIISIYLIWDSLCEHGLKKVMGIVCESDRCAINAGYWTLVVGWWWWSQWHWGSCMIARATHSGYFCRVLGCCDGSGAVHVSHVMESWDSSHCGCGVDNACAFVMITTMFMFYPKKKKIHVVFFFFRIVFNLKKQCFQFAYVNLSIGFRWVIFLYFISSGLKGNSSPAWVHIWIWNRHRSNSKACQICFWQSKWRRWP